MEKFSEEKNLRIQKKLQELMEEEGFTIVALPQIAPASLSKEEKDKEKELKKINRKNEGKKTDSDNDESGS